MSIKMPDEIKVDLELDLTGLLCPLPIIRMSQKITSVPVGGVMKMTATDPGTLADIPAWTRSTGNQVLKYQRNGSEIVFYIKRLA